MIAIQMTHFLSPSRLSNSILDTFAMSTLKSLVLAFIWILLLSFIFILFVCILGVQVAIQVNASDDFNTFINQGLYWWSGTNDAPATNNPGVSGGSFCVVYRTQAHILQMVHSGLFAGSNIQRHFFRIGYRSSENPSFLSWQEIGTNIPTFYKNYANLSSLATACGIDKTSIKLRILEGGDADNPISTYFYLLEIRLNTAGQTKRGIKLGMAVFAEPQVLFIKNTDTDVWKTISLSPLP